LKRSREGCQSFDRYPGISWVLVPLNPFSSYLKVCYENALLKLTSQPLLAICLYNPNNHQIYACLTSSVMHRRFLTFNPMSNDYLFSRILLSSGKGVQWLCFHKTTTHRYVWYSLKPRLYCFTCANDRFSGSLLIPKAYLSNYMMLQTA